MSERERDNEVRYRGDRAERGHVESHFLKATSPDGKRAVWLKHTILSERGAPERATAQLWAIAFDRRGDRPRAVGAKRVVPIAEARFIATPFSSEVAGGRLDSTSSRGEVEGVRWDLRWTPHAAPFHLFPLERLYTARFPKQKQLCPTPDATFGGWVEVAAERWEIDGWPGMQGHNWGVGNSDAYVWAQCNAWSDATPGTWFEGATARLRLGPVMTPWLSVMSLHSNGQLYRFDHPRAVFSRAVEVALYRWRFTAKQGPFTLEGHIHAQREDLAGLVYDNPAGPPTFCLNSKLAHGTLVLRRGKRRLVELSTDRFALELGTKDPSHGVPMLA